MDLLIKEIKELEYAKNITKGYKLPVQIDDGTILQCNVEDIVNLALSDVNDNIVQTISYDDLAELKSGDGLKAGKFYKIEYTTKHIIPNTEVINEGTLENLIILATSANTFHNRAISIEYPKDEIDYNFDDNLCEDETTARPGFITRRKDNLTNNEVVGFDFKNAKFRRFVVDLVASCVTEWVDTEYIKGNLVYLGTEIFVCIKDILGTHAIKETEFWLKICNTTDYICLDSTGLTKIYINNTEVTLKGDTTEFIDNYLFDYTNESNINNYVECTVFNNNTISGGFNNNTISGYFYENTINGDFYKNLINVSFFNNLVSNGFYLNMIYGDGFYNNILNGGFYNNLIISEFYYNLIYTEFLNNLILAIFLNNLVFILGFSNNYIAELVEFKNNSFSTLIQNIDFSLSTHVSASYNKIIGLNSSDVLYLSYIDGDNVQQIVNITD